MSGFVTALIAGGVLVAAASAVSFYRGRAEFVLKGWARRNGFTLVHADPFPSALGPRSWRRGGGQSVYHVTLSDKQGRTRRAWVRCGGQRLGMLCEYVEVRWEG